MMSIEEIREKVTLSNMELKKGNYILSNKIAEEIIFNIEISETNDIGIINPYLNALLSTAWNYRILGEKELAKERCLEALLIAQKFDLKVFHATTLDYLGEIYKDLGDYRSAIEYFEKALLINLNTNKKGGLARSLSGLGIVYRLLSDYEKALDKFLQSLKLFEEIDLQIGVANTLLNIGNVYVEISNFENSLENYFRSLKIFEENGYKIGIANVLGNIGIVYQKLKDYDNSLQYLLNAIEAFNEIGVKEGIANSLLGIGEVYFDLMQFDTALDNLKKALKIYEEIESKQGIADCTIIIGKLYNSKTYQFYNILKAESFLFTTIQIAEEIGSKLLLKNSFEILHKIRVEQKHFEEALDYQTKAISLEREISISEAKKLADRFEIERKSAEREKQLAIERTRYEERENILRNILPDTVTDRLVKGENPIADHIQSATVLFMDLVGFTSLASIAPAKQLVYLLDSIFTKADEVAEQFGLEKIKTIGDGYLAVANVTTPLENHQLATALAALQLLETMKNLTVNIPADLGDTSWIKTMNDIEIRIGIHTGEVVAGIIGKNKYTYDLWGDAVNVASRMESNSEAGRIHISEAFAKSIELNSAFSIIPRGEINIKGKGTMNTYWLEKAK